MSKLLALLSLLTLVACDDTNNVFLFPKSTSSGDGYANNMVFQVGQQAALSWTTTWQGLYWVELWQQNIGQDSANNISVIYSTRAAPGTQTYNWTVDPSGTDISKGNVFYLVVRGPPHAIGSWYFNMTMAAQTASQTSTTLQTSISQSSTAHTPTSQSTTSGSVATASAVPTNAADTNGTTDLSTSPASSDTAVKVGLGVGLGIGIPLIVISTALVVMFARRRRQQGNVIWHPQQKSSAWQKEPIASVHETHQAEIKQPDSHPFPEPYSELSAYADARELPANSYDK